MIRANRPVGLLLSVLFALASGTIAMAQTFPKIEASFLLPQVKGNPFDYLANDVKVTIVAPNGSTVSMPAFFDGGTAWCLRYTPTVVGQHRITGVTLNGTDAKPEKLSSATFDVAAKPSPGFVRISKTDKMRFAFDDGSPFYPLGYNLAWHHTGEPTMPPLVDTIAKMGAAGVNWSRIWMNYWDGKNLEWIDSPGTSPKIGELDLTVAKSWDGLLDASEKAGIHFQLVLQHHGAYSAKTDPNWQNNPFNKVNGGWLDTPDQFFTDARAIALTKAKYRYIIARFGYSTSIMAWELFNEVENTEAFQAHPENVIAWHNTMAKFLRQQDPYHHLITTSSRVSEPGLWPAMDYYQPHAYPPDLVTAIESLDERHFDKPYFYGEIGGSAFGSQATPARDVHQILWASMMSGSAGTAQYWYWYLVEANGSLDAYASARKFIDASGLATRANLKPIDATATTADLGTLSFGPGLGWAPSKGTQFVVDRSGRVEGLTGMSAYLQGAGQNSAMFPFAEFKVDFGKPGTFAVKFDAMTPAGVKLTVLIDGAPQSTLTLAAPQRPKAEPPPHEIHVDASIEVPIAAGPHVIRLQNTADDWIRLRQITLTPYASKLSVHAKGNDTFAALWIDRREKSGGPVEGTVSVPGFAAGNYRIVWFDPYKGVQLRETAATAKSGEPLTFSTGPLEADVAVWIERAQ